MFSKTIYLKPLVEASLYFTIKHSSSFNRMKTKQKLEQNSIINLLRRFLRLFLIYIALRPMTFSRVA